MSGDIGILTGITIGSNLWDKIKNYASQKEDVPKAETEAKLLAQASVDFKEERSWWEVLLFGGASGGGVAGCGYGAEKLLNKPRDGGVDTDAYDGGDGDAGDGDAGDGDGGVECNNYPGSFNLSSPPDSNSATSLQPYFDWTDSIDPDSGDSVSYSLLIDTDNSFPAPSTYNDISASEFNLTTPLANNTTYYWKVIAKDLCDQETESADVFNFTTVVACSTSPNSFSLISPTYGSTDVSLTPTFDWEDAIDPDVGDAVTYTLQIDTSDLFPAPTEFADLTESTYTMTSSLEYGTTYYWRVIAKDGCDNEVTSTGVYSFTTETACVPQVFSETDFTTGTPMDLDITTLPGTLLLDRSWTVKWHANEGILPSADTPAWSLFNPGGGSIPSLGTDPSSGEDALLFDTTGLDNTMRYTIDPESFSNITGWAFQFRARLVSTEGSTGDETSVEVADAARIIRMGLAPTSVIDGQTGSSYGPFDTITSMHTYRVQAIGDNFSLYIDEGTTPVLTGTMATVGVLNYIRFGDMWGNPDSVAYWNHVYYYTGGNVVPFVSPGSYSRIIDTGTSSNDFGSGATFSYASDEPVGTSLLVETRTGNTAIPDGSWSSWAALVSGAITSPAARYLEVRFTLSTTIPSASPQLHDYTINYCTY